MPVYWIEQLPATLNQGWVAGDLFTFEIGPFRWGDTDLDLRTTNLVCQYRDHYGSVLAQPEPRIFNYAPTIAVYDLSPDLTRFLAVSDRPWWGVKWVDADLTLLVGDVSIRGEVIRTIDPQMYETCPTCEGRGFVPIELEESVA